MFFALSDVYSTPRVASPFHMVQAGNCPFRINEWSSRRPGCECSFILAFGRWEIRWDHSKVHCGKIHDSPKLVVFSHQNRQWGFWNCHDCRLYPPDEPSAVWCFCARNGHNTYCQLNSISVAKCWGWPLLPDLLEKTQSHHVGS